MKTVLQHILRRKRAYAQLPFFQFLRDETLGVRERLSFFPAMAPFIMSFGDLNRYVLREEPSDDAHQRMINAHTYEDDHHWPWYLEDFAKLGFDRPTTTAQALRSQFGDAFATNRLLSHRLAHAIWGATPAVRLALVEAIEETGNVLFAQTVHLARAHERDTGVALRYLGDFHFQLESGHAMNNEHAELARIEIDEPARRDALVRVDLVFEWFEAWTGELLEFAQRSLNGSAQAQAQPG